MSDLNASPFITLTNTKALGKSRYLAAGTNITLTDNGAQSSLVISAASTVIPPTSVITPTTNTALSVGIVVVLSTDSLTHTLPTSPAAGSTIWFQVGNVSNVIIAPGGANTIQGSSNSFQCNVPYANTFVLRYFSGNWTFTTS